MNNLLIHQKTYDLILYFFPIIDRFPKHEKFALSTYLKNVLLKISQDIIRANKIRNKKPVLYELDIEIEQLRLLIRLSYDRKYLSIKSYEHACKRLNEIGKLLGGWLKSQG